MSKSVLNAKRPQTPILTKTSIFTNTDGPIFSKSDKRSSNNIKMHLTKFNKNNLIKLFSPDQLLNVIDQYFPQESLELVSIKPSKNSTIKIKKMEGLW